MVIADLVDTLSRIGAIGGILSIIGVGLLILLVASQNRQIRSMREWIDEEPQRQQETAQRVIAEVQRRIAAARERRAAASGAPVAPAAPPAPGRPLPAAPGTLGATPEAQKLVASKELVPPGAAPAEGEETVVAPGGPDAPKFAPLTPAGGAEAGSVPPPADPADEDPAVVSEFLNQETQAADALPDHEPALASDPADVRYGEDQFDLHHDEEPRGGSRLLFGVGVVALLAGIVLAFVLLFSGGDGDADKAGNTPPAAQTEDDPGAGGGGGGAETPPAATTVDPGSVTVRVLNGTTVSGLAQRVTDTLKGKGYGTDRPDTYSGGQTVSQTTIKYRQGQKAAAVTVAKDLGLSEGDVEAIDSELSVAAGPTADVVVLTGTDLDSTASTTGE